MRFPTREAYVEWWGEHPAIAAGDVDPSDLRAYAEQDLTGTEPELRSRVNEEAVRADAGELATLGTAANRLRVPTLMLCAPRGLMDQPQPMQPIEAARVWAADDPERREARLVEDVNHYTIAMGARGAAVVADAIATATTLTP